MLFKSSKEVLKNVTNQIKDVTPAESVRASFGSFSRVAFSSPPPDVSNGAFPIYLSTKQHIVKEISMYPQNIQVSALEEMLLRLEKVSTNE